MSPMNAIRRSHEYEFDAQHGLPEKLPECESILWQGSPDWTSVARRVFHVYKVALYFAVLLAWRGWVLTEETGGPTFNLLEWWRGLAPLALFFATGLLLLVVLARMTARTTVYTLTNKRVVLRIGIVLTVAYNLPLVRIERADLRPFGANGATLGLGDIALTLPAGTRIAYLMLWPHARPWRLKQPEPMLRSLPDAAAVAQRLSRAWAAANGRAVMPEATPVRRSAPVRPAYGAD